MTDYITPQAHRAPQLTAEDLTSLTPADTNTARRLGQLEDVLNPTAADVEPLPADKWDRMTPHDRAAMVRTYGTSIDPTTPKN